MEDRVGADDPMEEALLVGGVEILDGGPREERQRHRADHFFGAHFLEVFHALDQGAAGADHVVGHEDGLALHVAQKAHFGNVGFRGVARDLGIVALLVQQGQRALQGVGVELVAVHRAGVGRQDDDVLAPGIDQAEELFDDLERRVQVFKPRAVEAVFDFLGVDVQGDDARGAQVFHHGADAGSGKAFAALFLVLARVGVGGQHEVDAFRAGLHGGVHRDEKAEDVVVDGQDLVFRAVVEGDGLVVFDVLDDVQVLAAHGIQDFGLDFAVGEERVARVDFQLRQAVAVRGARHVGQAGCAVVGEVDVARDFFGREVVPGRESLGLAVESALVDAGELADHLVRESFGAGAGKHAQLRRVRVAHGVSPWE